MGTPPPASVAVMGRKLPDRLPKSVYMPTEHAERSGSALPAGTHTVFNCQLEAMGLGKSCPAGYATPREIVRAVLPEHLFARENAPENFTSTKTVAKKIPADHAARRQ